MFHPKLPGEVEFQGHIWNGIPTVDTLQIKSNIKALMSFVLDSLSEMWPEGLNLLAQFDFNFTQNSVCHMAVQPS